MLIKKEILIYLYRHTDDIKYASVREIANATGHSWKTIERQIESLVTNNLVIRLQIMRKIYEYIQGKKTGRYRYIETEKYIYRLNFELAKERGLI